MGFTSSTLSRPGATGGIAVVNSKDAGKAIGHRSLPDGVMTEMEVRISMRLIDAGQTKLSLDEPSGRILEAEQPATICFAVSQRSRSNSSIGTGSPKR
jgi:hypothetical protein